jgi:hypothetical protein
LFAGGPGMIMSSVIMPSVIVSSVIVPFVGVPFVGVIGMLVGVVLFIHMILTNTWRWS